MRKIVFAAILAMLVLTIGFSISCGDDDDDDDDTDGYDSGDDDDNQEAANSCDETVTLLAEVGELSELLGISAQDVLDLTGGGFAVTALYSSDTSILTQNPLGGQTDLTVTIAYDGGEIRQVESVPVDDGTGAEIEVDCRNRLEIDVTISVTTADGAFDETWSSVLVQTRDAGGAGFEVPTLANEFDPTSLQGSFEIVSIAGETPDSVTGVFGTTATDPIAGSVVVLVEQSSGEGDEGTVSQAQHTALSWGVAQ